MVSHNQEDALPEIYLQPHHKILIEQIDSHAKEIIHSLKDSGLKAYLVGGCIRDLVLNKDPKDFDVVTEATPEQINRAVPRSRIIGRRFKLVHVRKGRKMTEVSTFRSKGGKKTSKTNVRRVSESKQHGSFANHCSQ